MQGKLAHAVRRGADGKGQCKLDLASSLPDSEGGGRRQRRSPTRHSALCCGVAPSCPLTHSPGYYDAYDRVVPFLTVKRFPFHLTNTNTKQTQNKHKHSCLLSVLAETNIPAYYQSSLTFCILPNPGDCPAGILTPGNVQALDQLPLPTSVVAAFLATLTLGVAGLYWVLGLLIFWRMSGEWMGLFFSLPLVILGATGIGGFPAAQAPQLVQRLTTVLSSIVLGPALFAFGFTFPTGRFTPRWTWAAFVIVSVMNVLPPVPFVAILLTYPLSVGVQVYRYVRVYDAVQRQQTKWFVFGIGAGFSSLAAYYVLGQVVPGLGTPASWYQLLNPLMWLLIWVVFLLTVSIAIFRYRLWDIDIIINRTLVYATLSAGIVGVYVLIVGGLGTLLQVQRSLVLSLLTAALVAILFQPLRQRLQHTINRLMYGERDDPYRVISRLGQRLEATLAPATILPTIVETVAQALKLPYAAIALQQDGTLVVVAFYGTPKGGTATATGLSNGAGGRTAAGTACSRRSLQRG
jgi:hypothetical protein